MVDERPPLTVRTNTLRTTRDALAARLAADEGVEVHPTRHAVEGLDVQHGGMPASWRAFGEGLLAVQDEASMLVSRLLDPRPGDTVADVCAAPGTKTSHLAQLMENRGRLLAFDPQPARLARLREAATRLGIQMVEPLDGPVEVLAARFTGACDAVLVDAPCSGLGTLRRRADARWRIDEKDVDRLVTVWCGSTEVYRQAGEVHSTIEKFERGLDESHPDILPSMIYAYAALKCGVPFANGAPNLTVDIPALMTLADKNKLAICGKDFKTGQTLMKTIIAPGLKSRMLGLHGWYSTNILGNRDGEVLDDPESFKTKEESKKSALDYIFQPHLYPQLYGDLTHVVRINYYPPRGDNKEGWDNIDIFGWLGYPMQLKINFLCRDSILAAPIVLDVALFLDLAKRTGMSGIQEWLSFYFKAPMHAPEVYPEHDLFIQLMKLKNTLRFMQGEELITHLGREYYD